MSCNRILVFALAALLILPVPAGAQEIESGRDPWALARRLLGYDAEFAIPLPTPLYDPGATTDFWVSKANAEAPVQISATLAGRTRNIYLWVEDGLSINLDTVQAFTVQVDQFLTTLRLRSIYGDPSVIPELGEVTDPTSLLTLPDIDRDPHLFIVYAADLGNNLYTVNTNDQLPQAIAPGGYSNQHETIFVNTSALPNTPLDSPAYLTVLSSAMYQLLAHEHVPGQDQWLKEASGDLLARLLEAPEVYPSSASTFMQQPNISLISPSSSASTLGVRGGQQIFLSYLLQRFGFPLLQQTFLQPGTGLEPLTAGLAAADLTDPVSGHTFTGDQLFAEFIAANVASYLVSQPFGDGRYVHLVAEMPPNIPPSGYVMDGRLDAAYADVDVSQYGTRYFYIANSQPASFNLTFNGQPVTHRLSMPADASPDNQFYWSGRLENQAATLTRTLDLSAVDAATLTFDVWYDLPQARSYGYVEVSTDDGATWTILESDQSSTDNRFGLAYGPGYTGVSSLDDPRPFPIIGVLLEEDGLTIREITPGGPASSSDLQAEDIIVGYDGHVWEGPPDVIGLVGRYEVGDTLELYVQRGNQRMSVPVVLGEHPSRFKLPDSVWLGQQVDLSDYAGQEILLRFEYISAPQGGGTGFAVDNIAVSEIDFTDDAEEETDWTLNGWQQVDNQVEQNFLVQYITSGTEATPPRVRQLISPASDVVDGEWRFDLLPEEIVVFTISGLNADTVLPAHFDIQFERAD
ncbi:MAG: hypothetical protein CL610_00660 [Anaerolineaceae bacterium]|nr:hypothetical protein [Anaerolineaceae bacterium]